jgi:hypothetical protein
MQDCSNWLEAGGEFCSSLIRDPVFQVGEGDDLLPLQTTIMGTSAFDGKEVL